MMTDMRIDDDWRQIDCRIPRAVFCALNETENDSVPVARIS
jgi:hypothetical protein